MNRPLLSLTQSPTNRRAHVLILQCAPNSRATKIFRHKANRVCLRPAALAMSAFFVSYHQKQCLMSALVVLHRIFHTRFKSQEPAHCATQRSLPWPLSGSTNRLTQASLERNICLADTMQRQSLARLIGLRPIIMRRERKL